MRPAAIATLSCLAALAAACAREEAVPRRAPAAAAAPERPEPPRSLGNPRVEMRNVHMIVDLDVVLEVRSLRGELEPTEQGAPPWFDDPRSFRIRIAEGETAISPASLSALLNRYVFSYPGAPLADLEVGIEDGRLRQRGVLKKKVEVDFDLRAKLSVTAEGLLRLRPEKVRAAGIPVKKVMDLFDIELAELITGRPERGFRVEGDDLLLDPARLLPPPAVEGRVGAATLEPDRIVLTFVPGGEDSGRRLRPALPEARNYMFFRSGRLRFGKLTMDDTDLQIVDADPDDPFAFFLERYLGQLVAGHSNTMADKGLVAVMPDYGE